MADTAPFYRMGEPNVIPVSPTSGSTQFTISKPKNATSFRIVNNNPFPVRLRGTTAAQAAAADKISVVLSVPALGVGVSYSIPCAVYAVNR